MNHIVVSIILPSIRQKNLPKWYAAAKLACQNYNWEVIIVSPYNLPEELNRILNIKYIKSDRNPVVCKQIGVLLASGKFLFNTTDDAILFPHSLDNLVDLWNNENLNKYDIINGKYREGVLDVETLEPLENLPPELPEIYWQAHYHQALHLAGISQDWKISLHFFMLLSDFYSAGGLDCTYYKNSVFSILELMFRQQKLGGKLINSV